METLPGEIGIGHVRYSTAGSKGARQIRDVQPFFGEFAMGGAAIAHNGNIVNAERTAARADRARLDLPVVLGQRMHHPPDGAVAAETIPERMKDALRRVEGAFSIVAMTRTKLIGVRDPLGVRPLVLGRIGPMAGRWRRRPARSTSSARNSCARSSPAKWSSSTARGGKLPPLRAAQAPLLHLRACLFLAPRQHHRRRVGLRDAAPDRRGTGPRGAGRGRPRLPGARQRHAGGHRLQPGKGIPYAMGIIRNQYMGRTFIEPTEQIRNMGVRLKLNVNRALVRGKRVILVDDSVVRGTTSRKIKEMILDAGAAEVHFRIASPAHGLALLLRRRHARAGKAARRHDDRGGDARPSGVDSLRFISLDGLYRAVGEAKGRDPNAPQYCDACFSGAYPVRADRHAQARLRDAGRRGVARQVSGISCRAGRRPPRTPRGFRGPARRPPPHPGPTSSWSPGRRASPIARTCDAGTRRDGAASPPRGGRP
jgi:amidophosphoribosyltransferase